MASLNSTQIVKILPTFISLRRGMNASSKMWDGRLHPTAKEASSEFLEEFETLAGQAEATVVFYVKISREAIFLSRILSRGKIQVDEVQEYLLIPAQIGQEY